MNSFVIILLTKNVVPDPGRDVVTCVTQGNYKNIILSTCEDSCPKDELLTNLDLSAEDVLNGLMKKPSLYTKVER